MIGRPLGEGVWVAGQISPADVAAAAAHGVTTIVNNRPDFEEPGQPTSAEIEAATREAGIDYVFIPVAGGFSGAQAAAMEAALADAAGDVLLFCKSGTRSTHLWALTRAAQGADPNELIAQAAQAGYDLAQLRPWL
jgi:uncharacterized protein (TIGR01244 family)